MANSVLLQYEHSDASRTIEMLSGLDISNHRKMVLT